MKRKILIQNRKGGPRRPPPTFIARMIEGGFRPEGGGMQGEKGGLIALHIQAVPDNRPRVPT